ncbi:MAG TPA: response regulator transcription factor [Acidobacteriaceae bacterium]|nr:response regulator transcription factor [Acidobacteriaceae bacterium]
MSTEAQPARIGVVASDPLRLLGMEAILSELPGMKPVPLELEQVASGGDLAVVIVEARIAGDQIADVISRLRRERPHLRIVVVGEGLNPQHIEAVIGAGAKGYLAETASESEIRMALEVVLDGSVWAPRKVLAKLLESGTATAAATAAAADRIEHRMTAREREVLELLMEGRSNRAIAESLGIDEATVKAHLGRMLRKTGAHNRVELTLRAIEERSNQ